MKIFQYRFAQNNHCILPLLCRQQDVPAVRELLDKFSEFEQYEPTLYLSLRKYGRIEIRSPRLIESYESLFSPDKYEDSTFYTTGGSPNVLSSWRRQPLSIMQKITWYHCIA